MRFLRISRRAACAVFFSLFLLGLSGCPDYSHQRPVPDYENMVDGGGEADESDDAPAQ